MRFVGLQGGTLLDFFEAKKLQKFLTTDESSY